MLLVLLLGFLLGVPPVFARGRQDVGTITGLVVDARTRVPIRSAQVYLVGTSIGSLTADNGRYILINVPAGAYEVRVERIGYAVTTRSVTVRAGASQAVNFGLEEEVLGLDEIVVTGEAGAARRREVGHAVSQINLAELKEPLVGVEGLLQGRATGLTITETSAQAGSGAMIRLRGNVSMSQSNVPLVYVDGVRIRSNMYPKNVGPLGTYQSRSGNTTASPLADLDPNAIERVEIIKGPAATTLYGTEAAAGVIQIFTKKGSAGRTRWTAQIDQGFTRVLPYNFYTDFNPYMRMSPYLRDGWRQNYHVSAQGSTGGVRYFAATSYVNNEYPQPLDDEQKLNVQTNLGFSLIPNLEVQLNTSFMKSDVQQTPCGNNSNGPCLNAYRAERNYVGGDDPELIRKTLDYDLDSYTNRLITGVTFAYTPAPRFSTRLAVGFDQAFIEHRNWRPFGFIVFPQGGRTNARWLERTLTADYSGSYEVPVAGELAATLSWGGQAIETEETNNKAYAENFPGPGETTVTSGSVQLASEDMIRVINAGFFGQVRFEFKDRFFLTAGLRMDGNSAFGENLGLEPYPKVSAAWVVSDEPFWKPALGTLKLRAAYGQSGRAPGAFDAVRTWTPVKLGTSPGFLPANRGNPDLGPERTGEVEVGADVSVLDNRVTAELTWYSRKTSEALFPVQRAPSLGAWSAQLENVGELTNKGFELNLSGTVIAAETFTWELGLGVATNHSKITDLGGLSEFSLEGQGFVIEGQPAPVIRGDYVKNPNELAEPIVEKNHIYGPNQPTTVLTPSTQLRFPGGITLIARGEYMGGFYIEDSPSSAAVGRSVRWPLCFLPDGRNASELIAKKDPAVAQLPAILRARCNWSRPQGQLWIYPADFFKLRELTLTIPVGFAFRWGESPTLSLSARNAIRWFHKDWWAFDPEMGDNEGNDHLVRANSEHVPAGAVYTASLRVSF
ncbi:MAG: TonB-dependent receptor [Gemmatimonadetes bacterium]|nr:TonB-dependent receptor [Gemmatimonadota bacterium]